MRLQFILLMLGISKKNREKVSRLRMSSWQVFLFTRIVANLKGSEVTRLIEAIGEKEELVELMSEPTKKKKRVDGNEEEKYKLVKLPEVV